MTRWLLDAGGHPTAFVDGSNVLLSVRLLWNAMTATKTR